MNNPKVDAFISRQTKWQEEFTQLRRILKDGRLTEDLKWGNPCYTFEGRNVILMHGFKEYCAVLFFKGALLDDPQNVLIRQSENVQASRQIRFTDVQGILDLEPVLKAYLDQAIRNEEAGLEVVFKETKEFPIPEELSLKFYEDPTFKMAFLALTPGRQRAYLLHFSSPKRPETRIARIEKAMEAIFDGKGLND